MPRLRAEVLAQALAGTQKRPWSGRGAEVPKLIDVADEEKAGGDKATEELVQVSALFDFTHIRHEVQLIGTARPTQAPRAQSIRGHR